ncbi:MAG: TolC family protein, partial [Bacteroidota bacterium]
NEERLTLLELNLERLETLVKDTESLFEEGFAEKIDVSRLKVNRNNLYTEYQKLKDFVGLSNDLLKFQMGMPISEPLTLSLNLAQITIEDSESLESEEINYSQRTDYVINQVNQELVALDLKNVRAGYLPSLRGQFQAGFNNGANNFLEVTEGDDAGPGLFTNEWLEFANIGVTLSIPIFDGLLKANQAQEKKWQAEQLREQQRLLENNISLEVKQARMNYRNNLASLEWQKENMELAREVITVSETKYREGLGSNLEVVEANTSLKEAQTNYYAAVYDLLISQIELKKSLGQLNN